MKGGGASAATVSSSVIQARQGLMHTGCHAFLNRINLTAKMREQIACINMHRAQQNGEWCCKLFTEENVALLLSLTGQTSHAQS